MAILKEEVNETTCLVTPGEEIEVYNAAELKEELMSILDGTHSNIIINLENVEYIDSSGLGVLVSTLKRVNIDSGKLILMSPKSAIKQILDLTSLDKVFKIVDNKESALTLIGG